MKSSLDSILEAKEERVKFQNSFKETPKAKCVLCMTINMPGADKLNSAAKLFFNSGELLVFNSFAEKSIRIKTFENAAGYCLMMALKSNPQAAKKTAVAIEEKYPWTRMLDIDIIQCKEDKPLSREVPRKCIVCDSPAFECSRSKKHSDKEIENKIDELVRDCIAYRSAELAYSSLVVELNATPKPGLVDTANNGSHKDLTFDLMKKSIEAIKPWLYKMAKANDFKSLRETGKKAEKAMLRATGNINTHKGAIFIMGILCFCTARLKEFNPLILSDEVKKLCRGITKELNDKNGTHGEVCYKNYKASGARGEAEKGYEFLATECCEKLSEELNEKGTDLNLALLRTLMLIISNTDDTNILFRSNEKTLNWAKEECRKLNNGNIEDFEKLDLLFREKNISPGGSADLLAGAWYFYNITLVAAAPDF